MSPEPRLSPFPYSLLCARHIEEAEFQIDVEPPQVFALSPLSRFASIFADNRISPAVKFNANKMPGKRVCNRHFDAQRTAWLEMPSSKGIERCGIENHASTAPRHADIDHIANCGINAQQRDSRSCHSLATRLVRIYRSRGIHH